jgi:uncharacterized protein (DUF1778 family)
MGEKKKPKPPSGAAKLKASGRKAIMLAVTPEQFDRLKLAASLEMRPVSQFVTFYAVQAADRVIAAAKGDKGD